jgi:predicted nucleic acid-binding protein
VRPTYLADVSVLVRLDRDEVLARVGPLLLAGEVATTALGDLDLLRFASGADDHAALQAEQRDLPHVAVDDAVLARAAELQGLLARDGRHRDVPLPALVTAAAAEQSGLVLLHQDPVLAVVAGTSGQPAEWAAP